MKTRVILNSDETEGPLKMGDVCFVDGYVKAADNRPYAVCVRESDGLFGFLSVFQLTALIQQPQQGEVGDDTN